MHHHATPISPIDRLAKLARYDVTTARGTVLCGGIESLSGAYSYADRCGACGWSGLLIKCAYTGKVVSHA